MTDATATSQPENLDERRRAAIRLAVGLGQGTIIAALVWAWKQQVWPHPHAPLYAALVFGAVFTPIVVLGGVGRLRLPVLLALALALGVAAGWIGWHGVARQAGTWGYNTPQLPPFSSFLLAGVFVFIGHHLVAGAEAARRWIAPHEVYFDIAWKNGVQLGLSFAFTGLLWGGLELGAALFDLIGVSVLDHLLKDYRVIWPVTGVAFAAAVQLTDVRIGLIQGIRTVGLALLSWLLPLMTLIAVAFLAALPVTGLTPLFATRSAASLLLSAAAGLIVLINAAYQTGDAAHTPRPLRWAARVAAVALAPLVAIAAYAIARRVGQYGWTPERIQAAACALIAAGYAIGYLVAAFARAWMRPLERTNVALAFVALITLLGLLTPIADPARLSAADQAARLLDGRTPLAKFDFDFLRTRAGRYGRERLAALQRLKGDPHRIAIAQAASTAPKPWEPEDAGPVLPLERRMTLYPVGANLPQDFIPQKRAALRALGDNTDAANRVARSLAFGDAGCLQVETVTCDVYALDIDGDGQPEVLVSATAGAGATRLMIFKRDARGHWPHVGELSLNCAASISALKAGQLSAAPAQAHDLVINGVRYRPVQDTDETCADDWPKTPLADY